MAEIIQNQPIQIRLDTGQDLTSATAQAIRYKKPDGTTGSWDAAISGEEIFVDVAGNVLDTVGVWYFHSAVTFTGNNYPTFGSRAGQEVRALYDRPDLP